MLNDTEKNILYKVITADNFISSQELSSTFNLSINTIRKEIDLINDYLKSYKCNVSSKISAGYVFEMEDEETATKLINRIQRDIQRFGYLEISEKANIYFVSALLLQSTRPVPVEELLDTLYCSKSTFHRMVDDLKSFLAVYKLKIVSKRNLGLSIEGEEWYKRQCLMFLGKVIEYQNDSSLFDNLKNVFYLNSPFRPILRSLVEEFMKKYHDIEFPTNVNIHIHNYLILMKDRHDNPLVPFSAEKAKLARSLPTYPLALEIYHGILDSDLRGVENENEILYLSALLACYADRMPNTYSRPEYQDQILELNHIIDVVADSYYIAKDYRETLIRKLTPCYFNLKFKHLFGIIGDAENVHDSLRIGLATNDFVASFATAYYFETGAMLGEEDLTNIYYIFNAVHLTEKFYAPLKVYVCSRIGLPASQEIALRSQLKRNYFISDITAVSERNIPDLNSMQNAVLFTDITPERIYRSITKEKVILFNYQHSSSLYRNFDEYINEMFKSKIKEMFHSSDFIQSSLKSEDELLSLIADLYRNDFSKDSLEEDLKFRNHFIKAIKQNGIAIFSTLILKTEQPSIKLIVNDSPLQLFDGTTTDIIIFYTTGNGSEEIIQSINYFLRNITKASRGKLSSLKEQSYDEIMEKLQINSWRT